jgi:hypothetical protein
VELVQECLPLLCLARFGLAGGARFGAPAGTSLFHGLDEALRPRLGLRLSQMLLGRSGQHGKGLLRRRGKMSREGLNHSLQGDPILLQVRIGIRTRGEDAAAAGQGHDGLTEVAIGKESSNLLGQDNPTVCRRAADTQTGKVVLQIDAKITRRHTEAETLQIHAHLQSVPGRFPPQVGNVFLDIVDLGLAVDVHSCTLFSAFYSDTLTRRRRQQ